VKRTTADTPLPYGITRDGACYHVSLTYGPATARRYLTAQSYDLWTCVRAVERRCPAATVTDAGARVRRRMELRRSSGPCRASVLHRACPFVCANRRVSMQYAVCGMQSQHHHGAQHRCRRYAILRDTRGMRGIQADDA